VRKDAEARLARAMFIAAALLVAADAQAQTSSPPPSQSRTLYRWTDADGRIQYSDKPPTGFKGDVTKVEIDLEANTRPGAPPARPQALPPDVLRDVTPDIGKQRREKRERLEQGVQAAEKKVALARAALEAGGDPKDDERNVVQRPLDRPDPTKSNCRVVPNTAGKSAIVCPALIPNDQYYERMKGLEDALHAAEEELSQAKEAYRRGVD